MADYVGADEQLWNRMRAVDSDNTAWLRDIVDTTGWPRRSRVGDDAVVAAWLLVQHADHDPAFQRRCLDLVEALPEGEVEATKLALLTDRVLLAEGRPQRYGTQAILVDGRYQVRETEDPEHVDERRAAVGLEPLATYLERFNRP